jgi:hypothetical protein
MGGENVTRRHTRHTSMALPTGNNCYTSLDFTLDQCYTVVGSLLSPDHVVAHLETELHSGAATMLLFWAVCSRQAGVLPLYTVPPRFQTRNKPLSLVCLYALSAVLPRHSQW